MDKKQKIIIGAIAAAVVIAGGTTAALTNGFGLLNSKDTYSDISYAVTDENGSIVTDKDGKTVTFATDENGKIVTEAEKTTTSTVASTTTAATTPEVTTTVSSETEVTTVSTTEQSTTKADTTTKAQTTTEVTTVEVTTTTTTSATVKKLDATMYVSGSSVNVRAKPDSSGDILGKVKTNEKLEVTGEVDGWYRINYNGKTAYIMKDYVSKSEITTTTATTTAKTTTAKTTKNTEADSAVTGSPNYTSPVAACNEVLRLVNIERAKVGVDPLKLDELTCQFSEIRAKEIEKLFEHNRPNGESYQSLYDQYLEGQWQACGENIAFGMNKLGTPEEVVEGWMNSDGHRANILSNKYKYMGIALYSFTKDGYKYYYWAQNFTTYWADVE